MTQTPAKPASAADRGMSAGLRAVTKAAGSDTLDKFHLRGALERLLYHGSKQSFRAGAAARAFTKKSRPEGAARSAKSSSGVFDLTPTDEQQMLQEAVGELANELLRPAASAADVALAPTDELLAHASELGLVTLGVPEELGGPLSERSATTGVIVTQALAYGDLGLATALLAPAAVSTALGLWGDGDQQATYLPAFLDDKPPVATFALMEPQPLFNPFALQTTARRDGNDLVIRGTKALVPLAATAELLLIAVGLPDGGHGLVLVESSADGIGIVPEPAMGIRAAGTATLHLTDVRVPATALIGGGDPGVYIEAIQRARLAWAAASVGTGKAVLDYVIEHVNGRIAFGEPISHRQSVAFAVSDIAIEIEGIRLATLRAASRLDMGKDAAPQVAVARELVRAHAAEVGSKGVQLLGGHGFIKEHPVERWYRDLRAVGLMEGALLV